MYSVYVYVYLYQYKSRTYTNIVNSSHNSNQSTYGLVASTRPVSLMPVPGRRDSNNKPVSTELFAPQGHLWGGWPNLIRPNQPQLGAKNLNASPGRFGCRNLTWRYGKIWWWCPTLVPEMTSVNQDQWNWFEAAGSPYFVALALTMTRILTWPTLPTLELLNHVESTYQLTRWCTAHQNAL